ncbi:MAG TPA: efflux RND transporter periplasmic adaptor subunit, partial [Planctomycetaceae bacterium]|nr:efflux RND transporter periplasmic adaptor subunit [Planctomycetaceae bacterium]
KSLLDIAQLNLEYTEVRAPVTGRISSRLVTEGNLIVGGTGQPTLLTTIVSLDPIYCVFDADEQSFLKYNRLMREGKRPSSRDVKNPVYVGLADEPHQYPHQGHMDFVDNRLDAETGTLRGRAILPNKDLSLTPGLFARLRLPGSGRYDAILIPDLAVGTDQSEKYVFVIDEQDTIRRQAVELGPIVRGLRIVRTGLDGSEQIVLRGLQRVQPGVVVQAKPETIVMKDDGLPLDAEPLPPENWLTRPVRVGRRSVSSPAISTVMAEPSDPDTAELD